MKKIVKAFSGIEDGEVVRLSVKLGSCNITHGKRNGIVKTASHRKG